jgi:succinate-semialdehyde dehydrogenase/glutarate-semialdehyde dehydrogenase
MSLVSINPANGTTLNAYPETCEEDVSRALDCATRASVEWRRISLANRASPFQEAAVVLREASEQSARLMAEEMGKPIAQGRLEIEKCANACEYFVRNAELFLADFPVESDARKSFVSFCPLGVILAIMPWNFPFWQVFRATIPAILAGNTIVLKHSSNVSGCALAIKEVFCKAGFPPGVLTCLLVGSDRIEALISDPRVQAVTMTGSTEAGRSVARAAGGALKKCVLELGGSDPYVILEDADLVLAARTCAASRLINSGQSCIAAKRFIVLEGVRREFEELLVQEMRKQKVGNPMDGDTQIGPLARADLRETVMRQVDQSIRQGARCLLGGKAPQMPGYFYPPTVLTDVCKGMAAYDEEVFGPVAAVIPVGSEQEAIRTANDSPYGLGACIFSRDLQKGEKLAVEDLDAGSCFVNTLVRSDPRLPFGGIKASGYGRELSAFGIREFTNAKTVFVA